MNQPRIIVQVSPNGETRLKADGFQGGNCVNATSDFERALGISQRRDLTTDFYQQIQSQAEISTGQSGLQSE